MQSSMNNDALVCGIFPATRPVESGMVALCLSIEMCFPGFEAIFCMKPYSTMVVLAVMHSCILLYLQKAEL